MLWKLSCCYQPLEQCSKCNPDHPQNIVAQTRTAHFYFSPLRKCKNSCNFFVKSPWSSVLLSSSASLLHPSLFLSALMCVHSPLLNHLEECACVRVLRMTGDLTLAGGHCQRGRRCYADSPASSCLFTNACWSTFSGYCLIQILNIKIKPQKVIGHNVFV